MSKNLIDDNKSIHVKETLFEEILNGFSKIKEKQDKILAEIGQFIRDPYQDENDAIEECNIIMGKLR